MTEHSQEGVLGEDALKEEIHLNSNVYTDIGRPSALTRRVHVIYLVNTNHSFKETKTAPRLRKPSG